MGLVRTEANLEMVKLLVESKADVHRKTMDGLTALHISSQFVSNDHPWACALQSSNGARTIA